MHFLKLLAFRLGAFFAQYGGLGLFSINLLDSSFLSFPVINDVLLIHLAMQHPERAPLYAILATLGSVLGSYMIYGIGLAGEDGKTPRETKYNQWNTTYDRPEKSVPHIL